MTYIRCALLMHCHLPPSQILQVERIVSERPSEDRCYLVKWEGLPYAEATWETERTVLDAPNGLAQRDLFQERQQRLLEPAKGVDAQRSAYASKKKSIGALDVQPEFLKFGQLRDYQLHGLNWLTYSWLQDRNCILADEMGLGKTVQCVSFLGLLSETLQVRVSNSGTSWSFVHAAHAFAQYNNQLLCGQPSQQLLQHCLLGMRLACSQGAVSVLCCCFSLCPIPHTAHRFVGPP